MTSIAWGSASCDLAYQRLKTDPAIAGCSLRRRQSDTGGGLEWRDADVITAPYDPDLVRLADRLGAVGDLCGRHGLRAVLEFFPWTEVPDLGAAATVVAASGRPDCGILLDTLHYARSGSTSAQFEGIPASRFPFVRVCDAPAGISWTREQLLHAGRVERLPPGEGGIDIKNILAHLPPGIPVALEVLMTAMSAEQGYEARNTPRAPGGRPAAGILMPPPVTCDLLAIGSGAGSRSAAVTAACHGLIPSLTVDDLAPSFAI